MTSPFCRTLWQEAAKKATDALLTTRDGQRCDIILDRACLTAIHKTGKESKTR